MGPQLAIVLKNHYPQQQRVTIFLATQGILTLPLQREQDGYRVTAGMVINSQLQELAQPAGRLRLAQAEILQMPSGDPQVLQFIHQILELCWHTLPHGLNLNDCFIVVQDLLLQARILAHSPQRALLLCKLLVVLGHYPEPLTVLQHQLWQILQWPIDSLVHQKIDLNLIAAAGSWLHLSILTHPQRQYFKAWQLSGEGDGQ